MRGFLIAFVILSCLGFALFTGNYMMLVLLALGILLQLKWEFI